MKAMASVKGEVKDNYIASRTVTEGRGERITIYIWGYNTLILKLF